MHALNEAYRVLNDPGRRALYDTELRARAAAQPVTGPAAPVSTRRGAERVEEPVVADGYGPSDRTYERARVPWRIIFAGVGLTITGVVLLSLFANPGEDPPPDGILRVGDCVEFEPDQDAREIRCTGEGDLVVRAFVTFDATCPGLTEPHRDRLGMGVACVDVGR